MKTTQYIITELIKGNVIGPINYLDDKKYIEIRKCLITYLPKVLVHMVLIYCYDMTIDLIKSKKNNNFYGIEYFLWDGLYFKLEIVNSLCSINFKWEFINEIIEIKTDNKRILKINHAIEHDSNLFIKSILKQKYHSSFFDYHLTISQHTYNIKNTIDILKNVLIEILYLKQDNRYITTDKYSVILKDSSRLFINNINNINKINEQDSKVIGYKIIVTNFMCVLIEIDNLKELASILEKLYFI